MLRRDRHPAGRTGPAGSTRPPVPRRRRRRRSRLRTRALGPDDGHVVDVVFAGMSERSRTRRFHRPMPTLSDAVRRALVAVDGDQHFAVAVEVRREGAWHPVGMGRIVIDDQGTAEVAVSVVDAWQGRGVGTRIVRTLVERARAVGVREVVAEVLADNGPMLHVLRRELPIHRSERDGSGLRLVCSLPGADGWNVDGWNLTTEDVLASLLS